MMAAFHGSGRTRPAIFPSLLRLRGRLPIGWVPGFAAGLASVGVYGGMVVGNMISAALALWIFIRGRWQKAVVPLRTETEEPPAGVLRGGTVAGEGGPGRTESA